MENDDTVDELFAVGEAHDDLDVERAFAGFRSAVLGEADQRVALQRYEIRGTLGSGGAGVVYEAFDPELERPVAIKLLRPDRDDPQGHQRLIREGKTLARLSHPNVVQVHDVGHRVRDDGTREVFIVMELVAGDTLAQHMHRDRDDWRTRLAWFIEAGRGLEAAHGIGLFHRDFKPGNVIVGNDGRVRVLDFGLARGNGTRLDSNDTFSDLHPSTDSSLTLTGTVMGTPVYMAPEQHRGEVGDARTDQFGFGVALYEGLYGAPPHRGDTLAALYTRKLAGPPRPPRGGIPRHIRRAVLRALEPRPDDRFASMADLLHELGGRGHRRRLRIGAGLGALGLLSAGGGIAGLQRAAACSEVDAQMHAVWNGPTRSRVRAGLERAGNDELASKVESRVDDYTARWLEARTQTCEDDRDGVREIDPRVSASCLDRSVSAVAATLTLLEADPDTQLAMRAVDLLDGLPDPNECRDPKALQREPPPPDDEATQRQLDALRRTLAEITILRHAADYDEAWSRMDSLARSAHELGYEPLLAEVELAKGILLAKEGVRLAEAETSLESAYLRAQRVDHRSVAASAATELTYVVGHRLDRNIEGMQWAKLAQAVVDPDDLPRQVRLDSNRAFVLTGPATRDFAGAHRLLRSAIARLREHAPGRRELLATALHNLAVLLMRDKKFEEATLVLTEAIELKIEHYGMHHPKVARAYFVKGALRSRIEDVVGAERAFADGIRTLEGLTGDRSLRADLQDNLATMLMNQHRWNEARTVYAQRFATPDPDTETADGRKMLTRAMTSWARVAIHDGEFEQARHRLDEAEALARIDEGDAGLGLVAMVRGQLFQRQGDGAAALQSLEDARHQLEDARGRGRTVLPRLHVMLAEARLIEGRPGARPLAEQAVKAYDARNLNPANRSGRELRARAWWGLAQTLAEDDPSRARDLADRAHEELTALSMLERAKEIEVWRAGRTEPPNGSTAAPGSEPPGSGDATR